MSNGGRRPEVCELIGTRKPWVKERVRYIRCLRDMGCSMQEAADALGITPSLVSYYASVYGISFKQDAA